MTEFPFQYGHNDADLLDGEVHFPTGVGVRGFSRCRDPEGRPGVAISFTVTDDDGEDQSIAFLMPAQVVGVLLGFITEYGDAAGLAAFLQAEADRALAEMHRLGYEIMSDAGRPPTP